MTLLSAFPDLRASELSIKNHMSKGKPVVAVTEGLVGASNGPVTGGSSVCSVMHVRTVDGDSCEVTEVGTSAAALLVDGWSVLSVTDVCSSFSVTALGTGGRVTTGAAICLLFKYSSTADAMQSPWVIPSTAAQILSRCKVVRGKTTVCLLVPFGVSFISACSLSQRPVRIVRLFRCARKRRKLVETLQPGFDMCSTVCHVYFVLRRRKRNWG